MSPMRLRLPAKPVQTLPAPQVLENSIAQKNYNSRFKSSNYKGPIMKKIIAVTGCPTGIAHTFMAEEALKTAAKKIKR